MPELPEVETVRLDLEPALIGRSITDVRTGEFAGVIGDVDLPTFVGRLRGHRFESLRRRGKYLIAGLDDGTALLIHLRMTGNLFLVERITPPARFEHLAIELDDGHDLRFADQRKFGRVLHVSSAEINALDAKLGPEPLSSRFTANELVRRLSNRSGRLKSVLLDQSLVAGLGNIYVDEALYQARLHPLRDAGNLSAEEASRLVRAIRAVLRQGLDNRGTSISHFRDAYGSTGANQHRLNVYGRGGSDSPCHRCGALIVRLTIGGRGSHFCPVCQPLPES